MNSTKLKNFFIGMYESYIPNKRDNLKQIIIKIVFLISFITLVVSGTYIANYFLNAEKEKNIIEDTRQIWYESPVEETQTDTENTVVKKESPEDKLKKLNSDFRGWLSLKGAGVDHPVYQTDNNSFYLNHNQKKESSVYGALYFDYENIITEKECDRNLIIYGHEMKNGSMFGSLKKLRNLSFYKENSTVKLTLFGEKHVYRIYAVFVLNASKKDDDGYIYNLFRKQFYDENDFNSWVDEAKKRSIINTNVDVDFDDQLLTLVTCAGDFENARLVVMAKRLSDGEDKSAANNEAHTNPEPLYPAKWYETKGVKKPEKFVEAEGN